jgi:molybdate transport system substrate-binding protein
VVTIAFPESAESVNTYPIAVLTDSENAATATAFEELVLSPEGQQVLADAGFTAP